MNRAARCLVLLAAVVALASAPGASIAAEKKKVVTSVVSATVNKEYRRTKKRDGSFETEYYALSLGGQAKETISHDSIDQFPRAEFEQLVKEQLAKLDYQMAPNAASAKLLIHVLWGMTNPITDEATLKLGLNNASEAFATYRAAIAQLPKSPKGGLGVPASSANQAADSEAEANLLALESEAEAALMHMLLLQRGREVALAPTAQVLGYLDPLNDLAGNPAIHCGLGSTYNEMWDDIAERRYYILVFAYDFTVLQKRKELKPLWVTRVNIRATGNKFDEQVAAMLARASRYFGRATDGLARTVEGRVEMGSTEVIGVVDDEPMKATDPSKDHEPAASPPPESAVAPEMPAVQP